MEKKGVFYKLYEIQAGSYYQFLSHLKSLVHTSKQHKRSLCLAMFSIQNLAILGQIETRKDLEDVIYEFGLGLGLLLRESDTCHYDSEYRWWVIMNETSLSTAKTFCSRLQLFLRSVHFGPFSGEDLDVQCSVVHAHAKESAKELMDRALGVVKK